MFMRACFCSAGGALFPRFLAGLEVAGTGLEEASPPLAGGGDVLLLKGLQVSEVGQAVGAGDRLQVEFDVVLHLVVEDLQEIAAELLAGRASEALAAPDRAERVFAAVALLHGLAQGAPQRLGVA